MSEESNLQIYFKEFIKTDSSLRGIDKIKPAHPVWSTSKWQAEKTSDHVCDLFVYEPRSIGEAQLGSLFMLGKIENVPKNKYKNLDFLLSLLISVIKREFYSDPRRSTLEALESSLNKANLYLADFTEKGNVEWIGNFNFICGAFSKNMLHITRVGKPMIKLFRKTAVSHIENKFPVGRAPHPLKTFGNIASGTILNGDKIMLSVKDILDIIPLKNLKELSKKSCHQIIESLKKLTENKNEETPMVCLVIEAKTENISETTTVYSPYLEETERLTRSRRSKAGSIIQKTWLISKKTLIVIFLIFRRVGLSTYKIISLIARALKKICAPLSPVLKKVSETKITFPVLLVSKRAFLKIKNLSLASAKKIKIKKSYYILKQNKPAFIVASILLILILILPFFIAREANYYIKMNNFDKLSAEIQELQKKADSALVYQDQKKAKGLLRKNQILLATLFEYFKKSPLKDNEQIIERAAVLQTKHQEQEDSINNIKRIEKMEKILDFSKSGFIVNPVGISKIKDALYFYELDSGILYNFPAHGPPVEDENDKTNGLSLIFISAKDELRNMTPVEKNRLVLLGQSGKAYLYNSNTSDQNIYSLDPAVLIEEIKDVKNFLSNFYILNTKKGNIIKFTLSQITDSSIKGKNWLLEPEEELKNAQSMAIDGSIYVLGSNGLITKYYRGKKAEEIMPLLEKPIAGNNKIFTGINFDNFYISDPKNKRLIILNKEGKVINQYVNNEFINLKDFWITNDEKEAYLLCKDKVYKISI